MLHQLSISNYALIDKLDIEFDNGLTIITGETGAGKSILLGALSLIMGERADAKVIRDASRKTVVEATFDIAGYDLDAFFETNDIDNDGRECVMRRELSPTGRSRAFINDTPVPVATMRDLATELIDIHSQHSNMLLAQPRYQLSIIDGLAANRALRDDYAAKYKALRELQSRLDDLMEQSRKTRADEDYIRFQLQQLQELALQPDEDITLEAALKRLSNATELKELLWRVEEQLNSGEQSAIGQLTAVAHDLAAAERNLDDVTGMADRVESVLIELKDIARTVTSVGGDLTSDPAQLEKVENRINDIDNLQRKHGVATVNELIALQHDYEQRLSMIENNDELIASLERDIEQKREQAVAAAALLTKSRRKAATELAKQLKALAGGLGLKNMAFEVGFEPVDLNADGADVVQFMVAFNKNQTLMPIAATASGGELSRVMLCIKTIVAQHMQLPTIIFDEVDTGVSGDTASMIGTMMRDIARKIQVLAITHLPQVAAHAHHHVKVYKTDTASETITSVTTLSADDHVMELARLLSGKDINQAAIDNARALIANSQQQ